MDDKAVLGMFLDSEVEGPKVWPDLCPSPGLVHSLGVSSVPLGATLGTTRLIIPLPGTQRMLCRGTKPCILEYLQQIYS